jgi:hypothetical protein
MIFSPTLNQVIENIYVHKYLIFKMLKISKLIIDK